MTSCALKKQGERLTSKEIKMVKDFHEKVAQLRGYEKADWSEFSEDNFECLIGSYNLIIKLGGGCPLKAAQVRRKMETRQDWKSDLPDFMKVELGLLTPEITDTSSSG